MATPVDPVAAALDKWRNNLIDLTRRNPLLSLKPNHTSYLEIVQPELMKVYEHIVVQGKSWLFHLPAESKKKKSEPDALAKGAAPNFANASGSDVKARANELVTTEAERAIVLKILTNLYRRAWTDYRERGLHILHLALGMLEWRDEGDEVFRSPLLLLPVKLERGSLKDPFQLGAIDEDPLVNAALAARLKQEFDFTLPAAPSDWEEKKPDQYLAEVKSAIAGLPGWEVHASVALTWFSFFKGVIFQDLQDNGGRLREHSIIKTLAGTPGLLQKATPISELELDETQEPQKVFHILDADGSQRLCLEAAARGESFVLIGPPGTGKSQTIANLIANSIAQGKKVLFVSEKMAALEVVFKRLTAVGLGEFCLELHSYKANKREVIKELGRCFEEKLAPQPQPNDDDFAKLKQRRAQLNQCVHALHQKREPMKESVWTALAELPRWQALPMVPLGLPAIRPPGDATTKLVLAEFTHAHLDELKQLLQRLQHHWHIRSETNYPWRGFKADRYSLQLRDEVVGLIDRVRARDDKLRPTALQYANQLGVQGQSSDLLKLGDLLEKRPPSTQTHWLTTPDFAAFCADFEKCAEQSQRLGQARKPLTERYGNALWKLPGGSAAKIEQAWKQAQLLLAPGDDKGADFLKLQPKLRAWAADTQKRIPGWLTELRAFEKWLALPIPAGAGSTATTNTLDPSVEALRACVRLANLGVSNEPPDRTWLENRQLAKDALTSITASKPAFVRYKQNRQYLAKLYDAKLFNLDLVRIGAAYRGPYLSWWRFFSWQYRKDRRAIAKCRPVEDLLPTVAHDMQLGAQMLIDKAQLDADGPERARLLGRYEKGLDSDIETAEKAARHAVEAHDLAEHLDCERFPPRCIDTLTAGSAPEKIRAAVKRLTESFIAWSHLTDEVKPLLPIERMPNVGVRWDECSLSALTQYAKDLQAALNQFGGQADSVLGAALPSDMLAFGADLKQAEELLAFEAAQATEAERWAKLFGAAYQGVGTDWDALRKAILWARSIRERLGAMQNAKLPSVTSELLLKAASATPPSSRELRSALDQYEHALHSLEQRYDAPGPHLDGQPLRQQPPETVLDLLTKWRERVGELADWVDWRYLPERFSHLGLKQFWDHLQQHDVVREQVVDLFLKSFWSGWIDAMFQLDPALGQYRRDEHEQLLKEFRELDRRILQQNPARIAAVLEPLQSQHHDGAEATLLMKEAHKKTKHLPLRQLFDSIPALLQQLKPCMLMSPLSVSQFLPADAARLQFDLIVFDEASQILPEDAVGAIYRGKQLVVTGDNQQLPPTTFFQQNADDGGEEEETPLFESILDACLGAAVPTKMLRWHYRSQHEHLIAFSNETYYDGRLFTFPSASLNDPMLGVQLHHVENGIYDRGGRRDNPREAEAVARLVLDHFKKTPEKTLGVIAFSYAQMDAVEDEIENQLRAQPDLERFVKNDRLEGFFVKNLETVQGDERDVILLSVGYGRDAEGKIELNFGPLNREGGERRLNVAVTRARQKLIVVSSIRARDLNLSGSGARGLAHLQRYLDFAERGFTAIVDDADAPPLPITGLHEDVMRELKTLGFDAVAMVGCGQCRIDIGVRDPKNAARFLLGIEFDGPMYAQASTARDRDRLRPEVLKRLGWTLHRIAAADWIHRKEEELTRLRAALPLVD